MAYLNYLYSATESAVESLRDKPSRPAPQSMMVAVSHLIAYWVQVQPLGRTLGEAVDGGTLLNGSAKHPLRDPCYHDPAAVRSLSSRLAAAWQQATAVEPLPPNDWYRVEIEKVLRVFTHAAECGECVVSALEPSPVIRFYPSTPIK